MALPPANSKRLQDVLNRAGVLPVSAAQTAVTKTALRDLSKLVHSAPDPTMAHSATARDAAPHSANAAEKVAAAEVVRRLTETIAELNDGQARAFKFAAALTEAVKLAQDGVIDVADVFDIARERLQTGALKLASLDDAFSADPGTLDDRTPETSTAGLDPLTGYLRAARGR
jgi:hypothetical protein